jgi:phosphohistidine phosphatase SixA
MLEGRTESALALVGHQPELGELISVLLTTSEHALELELKKGSVVSLRFRDRPAAVGGVLRWSASPKILRQLDR